MPNWCYNRLAVTGPVKDMNRFKQEAKGFYPWYEPEPASQPDALSFHSLVPIPADVLAAGYDPAGLDWECAHWGCKWGACHVEALEEWRGGAVYTFDTAWSPPVPFLLDVSQRWPSLEFILDYDVPMLAMCGTARAQAGKFRRARRR